MTWEYFKILVKHYIFVILYLFYIVFQDVTEYVTLPILIYRKVKGQVMNWWK